MNLLWAREWGKNLLFPRRCPVCDQPVHPFGALICEECVGKLPMIRGPVCCKCGKPLSSSTIEFCEDCRKIPHIYKRGTAVYLYPDIRGGIYRFKYEHRREYADYFGNRMALRFQRSFGREPIDYIVPVPLSSSRLKSRGYNQASLLAGVMSKSLHIPVREDILQRVKNTKPMKNMGISERRNNLKKAFIVKVNDVKLKTIVIVDDIYTTGATIDACAQVLREAGAKDVYFITLSIAKGEE